MAREQARCKTSEWLYKRGCAHDAVNEPVAEPLPVDIWIDPTPMLSLLFRIVPGQPAFILWAQFSARTAVVNIAEVLFELQDAPEVRFQLLPRPASPREPYHYCDGEFKIEQEQVVNACLPGTVYRHHPVEGYVMGVGYQQLPERLSGMVAAELSVVNEFGEVVGLAHFDLPLDPKEHGKRYVGRKTGGAFEPLDVDEEINPEVPLPRTPPIFGRIGSTVEGTGATLQQGSNAIRKTGGGSKK